MKKIIFGIVVILALALALGLTVCNREFQRERLTTLLIPILRNLGKGILLFKMVTSCIISNISIGR